MVKDLIQNDYHEGDTLKNTYQSEEDIRKFASSIHLLVMNNISSVFYEMLPLCGLGQAIAFSRFLTLQRKIVFGSHALLHSYRKVHKDISGNELENSLWERNMYLENSIDAYNSVVDYVYTIIYFNFNLFEIIDNEKIKTKDDILRISQNIKGNKLNKINEWISKNEFTMDFSIKFKDYRCFTENMRNLANDIKHRGCISIEGIELPRYSKVTKVIDGIEIDITDIVSDVTINLDSEIENLLEIHRRTVELQKYLYSLCNFKKQLSDFLNKNI